jgi:hypothetical protein
LDTTGLVVVRKLALLTIIALAMSFAGCGGKDPFNPGAPLGTFHVTARLSQSTCGPTPDPWEFDVRLNHDGRMLYWIQGGLPVSGQVSTTAQTELRSGTISDVRAADPKLRLAACSVSRTDVLDVLLSGPDAKPTTDPGATTTFTGNLAYSFAPTDGSDCSDQLASAGGGFAALPCAFSYSLSGAFKSGPLTSH